MSDRKRVRFQNYLKVPEYGRLKAAQSASSSASFRAVVANQEGKRSGAHINDYSHLLVSEELLLKDLSTFTWEYFQPIKLVQHVLDECGSIARLYAEKLHAHTPTPDHPWRIILGCDEHTPGSKVNGNNRRKNMALAFNFCELGPDILECDATWYVPVVVRAGVFKKLPGGWSRMLRSFLRQLLIGPLSFSCAGVVVPLEVNPAARVAFQLTAALQTAITDGEGIAKCLQWNGHGSMRPCFGHCNVFRKNAGMADDTLGFVDITCSDRARLREWTPTEFQRNVESVLEARRQRDRREMKQERLDDVIKAAGFAPTAEGLLADSDLLLGATFIRRWQYDWMHTAFQAGFMSDAMWLVFKHISNLKYGGVAAGGESMIRYLGRCQFPQCRRSIGRSMHHLVRPEMMKKHVSHRYIVANASVRTP